MWKSAPTGSSSRIQLAAGLHRGTGARRNVMAEDPLHLSTDPSPYHWIQKFALAISPTDPPKATRKNRAMIQVQKCRDAQKGMNILSKNPKSCLKLLLLIQTLSLSTTFNLILFKIWSCLLRRFKSCQQFTRQ